MDPAPLLSVRTSEAVSGGEPVTVLTVAGEIDMSSVGELRERLEQVFAAGGCRLVLDLSRVEFCDSTGLQTLLVAARRARERAGWVRLANVPDLVVRTLTLTGVDRLLPR